MSPIYLRVLIVSSDPFRDLCSDGAGNLSEQYDYEAFGKPYFYNTIGTNIPSSTWKNRYLGKGREWLADLKLYDYRHRLYQPELGRFLQPDPKQFEGGDYNLYRYCHNDPINKSDPMGDEWVVSEDIRADFNAARAYLSQDAGMKGVFDRVAASPNKVFVEGSRSLSPIKDQFEGYESGNAKFKWNPNAALAHKDGTQSPAMAAGHEAAHADRYLRDPKGYISDTKKADRVFGNKEDRRVITGTEAKAAKTLGEDARRDGGGRPFYVPDPLKKKDR